MGMDLGVKTFTHQEQYFEAGPHPISKAVKTAASGTDIPARAPVVLDANGKLGLVTVDDGAVVTTGLYGIAPEAITKGTEGVVYLTGEFFADSLTLPDNVTAADVEVPFRNIGIFLK